MPLSLQPQSMSFKRGSTAICPICGKETNNTLISLPFSPKGGLPTRVSLSVCEDCDFGFTYPANQLYYDKYYRYTKNDLIHQELEISPIEVQIECLKEFFSRHHSLNVLDFGCGDGDLIRKLSLEYPNNKYSGYDINGQEKIDPNASHNLFFFNQICKIDIKFDLIILSHVVEHIIDLSFIKYISSHFLNSRGILYIEVPDPYRYIEHPKREYLYYIDRLHVNHFSQKSLTILLNSIELNVLRFGRHILPYKDGGTFPAQYAFCTFNKTQTVPSLLGGLNDSLIQYIEKESTKSSILKNKLGGMQNVIVYGFGDNFFRSRSSCGPLSDLNIKVVIDQRWETLKNSEEYRLYQFASLEEALQTYPDLPILVTASWDLNKIESSIRQVSNSLIIPI
ncbi:MAG: hypothetical protein H6Q68_2337 [Firmicutes bacterium]|nr:hypothetical protein [Bacillota bacterium]